MAGMYGSMNVLMDLGRSMTQFGLKSCKRCLGFKCNSALGFLVHPPWCIPPRSR